MSPWPDLGPELLGLVLSRLPSLADRVRQRAVCRSWRHDAQLELLSPLFPWFTLLDGTFLCIPSGEIHRMPMPDDACRCHGSVGNWLFLEHCDGDLSLLNPFSKDVVVLPDIFGILKPREMMSRHERIRTAFKLVPLSSLDVSLDSPFAILIHDYDYESTISICRPTIVTEFRMPGQPHLFDIAFYDGKLYALSYWKLYVLEIDLSDKDKPRASSVESIMAYKDKDDPETTLQSFSKTYTCAYWSYLVESSGRLLHVQRLIGLLPNVPDYERIKQARTLSFEVLEADLNNCQWKIVNTLGGQALFIGPHSKSLPAFECGAQEDCIYFMCDGDQGHPDADPFRDSGVFNMKTKVIAPLLPEDTDHKVVWPYGYMGRPAWFYPS